MIDDSPSPFVVGWVARASTLNPGPGRALDIAMGRGRHTLPIARAGFRTFGVDIKLDAIADARRRGHAEGMHLAVWCADLMLIPLPRAAFDLVVVTRYLQRDLFAAIRDTVKPGGIVIYETFTVDQRRLGTGPTSADHLLGKNELRGYFESFDTMFYDEVLSPEAVARLAARKRS